MIEAHLQQQRTHEQGRGLRIAGQYHTDTLYMITCYGKEWKGNSTLSTKHCIYGTYP